MHVCNDVYYCIVCRLFSWGLHCKGNGIIGYGGLRYRHRMRYYLQIEGR